MAQNYKLFLSSAQKMVKFVKIVMLFVKLVCREVAVFLHLIKDENIQTMKIKNTITAALALIMATSCNAQNKQEVKSSNKNNMSKSIVIFFSHAGDNYSVGNIEVGNTKIVADQRCRPV